MLKREGLGEPDLDVPAERQCTVHEGLRKLVQLFPQVTRGLRRGGDPALEFDDAGFGPRHSAAVSLLRHCGPLSVGQMADEFGLSLATLSSVVTELERAGFVERSADPADRRRTIVSLLPERRPAIDKWLDGVTAPMARALDKLSPEERATFVRAMQYLEAELNVGSARPK